MEWNDWSNTPQYSPEFAEDFANIMAGRPRVHSDNMIWQECLLAGAVFTGGVTVIVLINEGLRRLGIHLQF